MKACKRGHTRERYASGACKECAREKHQANYIPKPRKEYGGAKGRLPSGERRVDTLQWRMYWSAKRRAELKNLPFSITPQDIHIPKFCPVFGTPLTKPNLDRKINSLGYTPENIRVISDRANRIKSDATLEEIQAIGAYMADS